MDDAFDVRLHRSGRTVTVPQGETILDILLDNGVNVVFSCIPMALRHLRNAGDRWHAGPSRQLPRRRGKDRQQDDDDLLLALEIGGSDARSLEQDPHRHTIKASAAITPLADAITGLTSIWSITSRRSCASSDSRQMVSTSRSISTPGLPRNPVSKAWPLQRRQHRARGRSSTGASRTAVSPSNSTMIPPSPAATSGPN